MYWDDLMDYRRTLVDDTFEEIGEDFSIMVHTPADMDLQISLDKDEDELKCTFLMEKEDDNKRKSKIFSVPPPVFPHRLVVLTLELISTERAHFWFGGNTRPFQAGFEAMSIKGRTEKPMPGEMYGEYYRGIENVDIEEVTNDVRVKRHCFPEMKCM